MSAGFATIRKSSIFVREVCYERLPADLSAILAALHADRATGTLTLNITQGAVGSAKFREEVRVDDVDEDNGIPR